MKEHLKNALNYVSPIPKTRPALYAYASDASAVVTNLKGQKELHGSCLRKQWFRLHGVPEKKYPTNPGFDTSWLGEAIHEGMCDKFRAAGTYVDSEVTMWDPVHQVSGRADIIFRDWESKELIGGEIKSKWGYHGGRGCINPTRDAPLFPDYAHIFQAAVYLNWFRQYGVKKWALLYIHRGSGAFAEHYITIPDYSGWGKMVRTPEMDAKEGRIEVVNMAGSVILDVGVEALWERWDTLWAHVNTKALPPRDYQLQYSAGKIQELLKAGELSKTDAAAAKKGNFVAKGDWRCRYCDFNTYCHNEAPEYAPRGDSEIMEMINE